MDKPAQSLFSEEALRHHNEGDEAGSPLRLSPQWASASYWVIVGAIATSILFACFGRVTEYADGPAVVRFAGRTDVISRTTGPVTEVLVRAGQRVASGDPLVRFDGGPELAELAELERQFELQLVRILQDPGNEATLAELASARMRREAARGKLDERQVRAPEDGVIGSLRVRPGQYLKSGDLVATINGAQARCQVAALIPGQHRPRLHVGMSLRLELLGFPYAYQDVQVERIGEQLVGPSEVGRFLGPDSGDAVQVSGPMVVVEASVANTAFSAEGRRYDYYEGMLGTANLALESRSVLLTLLPGLEDLLDYHLRTTAAPTLGGR